MNRFQKFLFLMLPALLMAGGLPTLSLAQGEPVCESDVIVQPGDWLSTIAEQAYGDFMQYPAIAEATNLKAQTDSSYATINNYDLIEPGWKLCIPAQAELPQAAATAPAAATHPTEVITFTPTAIPAETQAGSCFANAVGLGRADAWRCTVGNAIYDPCFAVGDDAPTVICGANPVTGDTGFVLALTEPLPAPDPGSESRAWLVELTDGQVCGLMTGTVPGVGDRVAPYGCPDQSNLFEDFQQGEVWQAEQATIGLNDNGFFVEQSEMVAISRIWQ